MVDQTDQAHLQAIWGIASNENFIISGSLDQTIKLWDIVEDELHLIKKLPLVHDLGITSVDISQDGKVACSTGLDNKLVIYELDTNQVRHTIELPPLSTYKCKISPSANQVAVCGQQGKISIFFIETGSLAFELKAQTADFLMSLSYSPCGNYVACGNNKGLVYIFGLSTESVYRKMTASSNPIRAISFSPTGQHLAVGCDDGKIIIFNPHHQNILGSLIGHSSWINSISIIKDDVVGTLLISSSSDTTIKFWSLENMSRVGNLKTNFKDEIDMSYQVWGAVRLSIKKSFKIVIGTESGQLLLIDQPLFQLK